MIAAGADRRGENWLETLLGHPRFIPICFVVFLALRALVFLVPVVPVSDAAWYFNAASRLAQGLGYQAGGSPTAYWPVGWPAILGGVFAVFGPSVLVGQILNLIAAGGTFFLTLALVRHLSGSEAVARLTVLLLAIYPNSIAYPALLMTETVYTFVLLLGLWLYIGRHSTPAAFASGLAFAVATYIKTQTLLIPLIVIAIRYLLDHNLRFRWRVLVNGAVLYLAMALVIAPWTYRNYTVFGEPVLISTNGGLTLLTGNNPSANGGFTPDDPLIELIDRSTAHQVAADKEAKALAIQWIKDNPQRFIALIPLKIWHLWAPDGEAEWAFQAGAPHYAAHEKLFRSIRYVNQGYYLLLMIGCAYGALAVARTALRDKGFHRLSPWLTLPPLLALYTTLLAIVFSGQCRFHFPVMPLLIMLTSYGVLEQLSVASKAEKVLSLRV